MSNRNGEMMPCGAKNANPKAGTAANKSNMNPALGSLR